MEKLTIKNNKGKIDPVVYELLKSKTEMNPLFLNKRRSSRLSLQNKKKSYNESDHDDELKKKSSMKKKKSLNILEENEEENNDLNLEENKVTPSIRNSRRKAIVINSEEINDHRLKNISDDIDNLVNK